jgi:adenine-specific DNA-methyltransferase
MADQKFFKTSSDQYYLIEPVIVENHTNANELKLRFRSRWAQNTIDEEYKKGTTFWVKSNKFAIRTIYHDGKQSNIAPKSLIFTNSNNPLVAESRFGTKVGVNENATMELNNIIQTDFFSYPKPVSLIEYLISLHYDYHINKHNDNLIILDFFAGSGTTLHATLKLNAEDGGIRQCIMVQQNEGEKRICEEVTYERNRRVMQGYTNAKGKKIDGLGGSLKYYKTAFTGTGNPHRDPIMLPSDEDRISLAKNAGVLVSLAENTLYKKVKNDYYQIFTNNHGRFSAVYLQEDLKQFEDFKQEIEELGGTVTVYVFSWGNNPDAANAFVHLPNVDVKSYPNAILDAYKSALQQIESQK